MNPAYLILALAAGMLIGAVALYAFTERVPNVEGSDA